MPAPLISWSPRTASDTQTLLVSNSYFTFERIDLTPNSTWRLEAEHETWLLVISGSARAVSFDVATGDTVFAQADQVTIRPAGTVWWAS